MNKQHITDGTRIQIHYFVDIASVKARDRAPRPSGRNSIELKIDTNVFHERSHLEDGILFVHLRPGRCNVRPALGSLCTVKIPGMD